MNKKILSPVLPYFAVWAGLFLFKSAWAALIGFHLAIVAVTAWLRPSFGIQILFKSSSPKWIALSVLLCGASGIGLYWFWDSFGIVADLHQQLPELGLTHAAWPWFITYFVIVNPLLEEVYWRGVLADPRLGLSWMDGIFAGYHTLILWGRVQLFGVFIAISLLVVAGWFWRQAAREDKGLMAAVFGHMAADLTILLAVRAMTL